MGYFGGRSRMAKRRNGESGPATGSAAHTTDAHERGKDFLNASEHSLRQGQRRRAPKDEPAAGALPLWLSWR